MRLAGIYTVWDDWDLFTHSHKNIMPLVDGVIVVFSQTSNFGEDSKIKTVAIWGEGNHIFNFEPDLSLPPQVNERNKRNFGLQKAKDMGFTHFIMLDADEFYEPQAFLNEKERIFKGNIAGTVCRTQVYFAKPTLTIGLDTTLVPFIHKITPDLHFTWNTRYPFAFEGPKREIRIDPTRQLNITQGVEMSEIIMHHYSWIRKDYEKKIRNSTARANIERSTIMNDLLQAKEGYFCEFYRKQLAPSADLFNLCQIFPDQSPSTTEKAS